MFKKTTVEIYLIFPTKSPAAFGVQKMPQK